MPTYGTVYQNETLLNWLSCLHVQLFSFNVSSECLKIIYHNWNPQRTVFKFQILHLIRCCPQITAAFSMVVYLCVACHDWVEKKVLLFVVWK